MRRARWATSAPQLVWRSRNDYEVAGGVSRMGVRLATVSGCDDLSDEYLQHGWAQVG
jgi:hypothetical protein